MKKIKLILFASVIVFNACSQSNSNSSESENKTENIKIEKERKCNACAFMDIYFYDEKLLYDAPNGHIISKLKNDTANLSFVMFTILSANDSMFYVDSYREDDEAGNSHIEGWISKENICIYSNEYSEPVFLYSKPDISSKIEDKINGLGATLYFHVIDCHEVWLHVKCFFKGKEYKGWLPPNRQCCLIFTTCT